ncbi:MAG: SDR family oxidoreductase [Parvibaculaceae bacterium]
MQKPQKLFCFGLGFSALAFSRLLAAQGFTIAGTCRSADKQAALIAQGIEAHLFGPDHALDVSALTGTTHLLSSVPPDELGDPVVAALGDTLRNMPLTWAGYLSTTGVYGSRDGDWVDETSPLLPGTERGVRRLKAEEQWRSLGLPLHIFRLAGIYGPGRNQLETMRTGSARRIIKKGQIFSRTHVDDIAQVLAASIAQPNTGAVYNVCDNEPAPPQEVVAYAAHLLGMEPPAEIAIEDTEMSPMAKSFYAESKRVSNKRIREELGVKLKYPTYREGLQALL